MDKMDVPLTFDTLNHTPPYLKQNEWSTLYNPFYYDLSTTKITINPEWASAPGITLNWLVQSIGGPLRVIFGVEADSPGNFLAFADRFAMGHNITKEDAVRLHLLGHATLAHIGTGAANGEDLRRDQVPAYAGTLANYTGIIGGELRFEHGSWWIDDSSGRYGSHRQQGTSERQSAIGSIVLDVAKKAFLAAAGIDVGIA